MRFQSGEAVIGSGLRPPYSAADGNRQFRVDRRAKRAVSLRLVSRGLHRRLRMGGTPQYAGYGAIRRWGNHGLSKPYAASGKYIQKQGDHCKSCRYDPKKVTGEGACPYNSLYWHFIHRHSELLRQNPRMGLILGGWRKRDDADRVAVLNWAEHLLADLNSL